jgi:hypothetical protein
MKRALLYLLLLCCDSAIYAQSINMDSIFEPKLRGEIFHIQKAVEGNQFYSNEWIMSDIKLSSGEIVFNKQLKYNILLDDIIWLKPNGYEQVKLEKHFINAVYFKNYNGKDIYFKKIRAKLPSMLDSTEIFVEVIAEKAASLYVFRTVRIEGTVNNVDGIDRYLDRIVPEPIYILLLPDRQTCIFKKISKHSLIKALPEKYKSSVKDRIQQNHLAIRNENDLTKLVDLIQY